MQVSEALNSAQRIAVQQELQPVLVLAGPGTGKTRVLIERIAYIIRQQSINAERILALTFTNKAAIELRERLLQLIGNDAEQVNANTFHAFALSVVRAYAQRCGLKPFFSVCDRDYQLNLVSDLCRPYFSERLEEKARGLLLAFSNHILKNTRMSNFVQARYKEYRSYLTDHNQIDFDLLILHCQQLLLSHQDVLSQYRYQYQAVLVDEFQDTDPIQYQILKKLTEEHRNIFVVADDDQSIYSWRGANPQNIRDFINDFEIKDPAILNINYRSRSEIIDSAVKILKQTDRLQPEKKIASGQDGQAEVQLMMFASELQEADFITKTVHKWVKTGTEYSEIAFIYPFHYIGEALERLFMKSKIPYQMAHGRSILDHPRIHKTILYLKLLRDSDDIIALETLCRHELGFSVYNHIKTYSIRKRTGFRQALYYFYMGNSTRLTPDARNRIRALVTEIASLINLKNFYTFPRLLDEILSFSAPSPSSILSRFRNQLEPLEEISSFSNIDFTEVGWIYVYHSDERVAFLACQLIADVLRIKSEVWPSRVSDPPKNSVIFNLQPQLADVPNIRQINVYELFNDFRQASASALFKLLQLLVSKNATIELADYVILDLETTDADPMNCGVVEIAGIRIRNGKIVGEMQSFIKPEIPISRGAQKVHHISNKDVKHAPSIHEYWCEFKKFIGDSTIIAHNGYNFDFVILDRYAREIEGYKLPNVRLDTLVMARKLFTGQSNSIDALVERFDLDVSGDTRHRALDDVKILQNIYMYLRREYHIRYRELALESYLDRVALSNLIENKVTAPEDKIFTTAGNRKLCSAYSKIRSEYSKRFSVSDEWIQKRVKETAEDAGEYQLNDHILEQIRRIATEFAEEPLDGAISRFLSMIALSNPQDHLEKINAVSLLTYHAVKGLEFDKVFLVGMEKDNMPGYHTFREDAGDIRSVNQKLQEQRRLLYVGMTRAKSKLVLTAVKNRGGRERESSPFLREIELSVAKAYGL